MRFWSEGIYTNACRCPAVIVYYEIAVYDKVQYRSGNFFHKKITFTLGN
uniref:Uncharacterized protein n=1 Tax=Rhizophora mucronata TaxID=61149 RepID=A0A2P2N4A9_RHIMU